MKTYNQALFYLLFLFFIPISSATMAAEVNLLSNRQEFLLRPFLNVFERENNIKVNVVYLKKGLLERLKARPGEADLILTNDIANLTAISQAGLLQSYDSDVVDKAIPNAYRDEKKLWTGLTLRARVFFYARDRIDPATLSDYGSLSNESFKGKICMRSGYHNYNVALISSMIAHRGKEETMTWLRALKSNLSRKPQGNDRAQVRAVAAGECDVAIGNTYYMGKMLETPKQREWAAAVAIFFPNQNTSGTHVNITGGAITKAAKNRTQAIKLLEFLTDNLAQTMYAQVNHEYPLRKGVELSGIVKSFGTGQAGIEKGAFKADTLPMTLIGNNRQAAIELLDRLAFDE